MILGAVIVVLLIILIGGINELIYFNNTCKRTQKGYDDFLKQVNKDFKVR